MDKITGKIVKMISPFSLSGQELFIGTEKEFTFLGMLIKPDETIPEKYKEFLVGEYLLVGIVISSKNFARDAYLALRIQMCEVEDEISVFPSDINFPIVKKFLQIGNLWNVTRPFIDKIV